MSKSIHEISKIIYKSIDVHGVFIFLFFFQNMSPIYLIFQFNVKMVCGPGINAVIVKRVNNTHHSRA